MSDENSRSGIVKTESYLVKNRQKGFEINKNGRNIDKIENIDEDKFVDLDKCVKMICVFNSKFNKYVPIKETNQGIVINKYDLRKKN